MKFARSCFLVWWLCQTLTVAKICIRWYMCCDNPLLYIIKYWTSPWWALRGSSSLEKYLRSETQSFSVLLLFLTMLSLTPSHPKPMCFTDVLLPMWCGGNSGIERREWRELVLAMNEGSDKGVVQYVDSTAPLGPHSSQIQCTDTKSLKEQQQWFFFSLFTSVQWCHSSELQRLFSSISSLV